MNRRRETIVYIRDVLFLLPTLSQIQTYVSGALNEHCMSHISKCPKMKVEPRRRSVPTVPNYPASNMFWRCIWSCFWGSKKKQNRGTFSARYFAQRTKGSRETRLGIGSKSTHGYSHLKWLGQVFTGWTSIFICERGKAYRPFPSILLWFNGLVLIHRSGSWKWWLMLIGSYHNMFQDAQEKYPVTSEFRIFKYIYI